VSAVWEITKSFRFESAHTLQRAVETEGSRRIHGHSYRAEIVLRGVAHAQTGMLTDLGSVREALEDARSQLDHHFLDELEGLGPATMENISRWLWDRLKPAFPQLTRITIYRDSLEESATYFGPDAGER
jgi:6-pyruvoyltetrahydropterin/6-carboxytetrahydropterin synthase